MISIRIDGGACIPWSLKPVIAQATRDLTQYIKTGPPGSNYRDAVTFFVKTKDGLCVPVQYITSNEQWSLMITEKRSQPQQITCTFTGTLRPQQIGACQRALKMIEATTGTVLCLPTGFGKTVCALHIVKSLGLKTLILVHKTFLMTQWQERIREFMGSSCCVTTIQGAEYDDTGDVVIAMMQTMFSRGYTAPQTCGLIIVDECHHVPAKTFRNVMHRCNTKYRLGLSATPERNDGLNPFIILGQMTGPEPRIPSPHSPGMIDAPAYDGGRIKVRLIEYVSQGYSREPPSMRFNDSINHAAMLNTVAEDSTRTEMIARVISDLDASRQVLCLVHRRAHAKAIMDALLSRGMDVDLFSPQSKGVCPATRVVVSTYVFASEGFDEKRFDTLVLCSPASDIRQSAGRILRKMDDPAHQPLIIDIVDMWSVFKKQAYKRRTTYRSMGCTIMHKTTHSDTRTGTSMFLQES